MSDVCPCESCNKNPLARRRMHIELLNSLCPDEPHTHRIARTLGGFEPVTRLGEIRRQDLIDEKEFGLL